METISIDSIPIVVGREDAGRWWADIESMPGVTAYGDSRELAIDKVRALALRVAADCLEHGEDVPEPFKQVFTVAWQNGSHRRLVRDGWPNYTFAFHDGAEIGPPLLARIAKNTGLRPEDL